MISFSQSAIQYLEIFLNGYLSVFLPLQGRNVSDRVAPCPLTLRIVQKGSGRLSFAETFKALSDPVRREILELLKGGRLSAGDIATNFDMAQATVSYHLKILKRADLIRETREKNFIYYELNLTVLEEIMVWLSDLKGEK